jgi:hypothetical protein
VSILTKSAKLPLISILFIFSALFFDAPRINAASRLMIAAPATSGDEDQTRTSRKRRPRPRRRSRRRTTPQSNTSTATEAVKPAATSQPILRVYDPAEDAPPPVRPTPTPGMKNP